MRVRIVDVSGTPQELAEAQPLLDLLRGGVSSPGDEEGGATEDAPSAWWSAVPEDVRKFILTKTSSVQRQSHVMRFVGEVLLWGNTEVEIGSSRRSATGQNNYLMLRHAGPRDFGAFVYVRPSTGGTTFRLSKRDVKANEHVLFRKVRSDNRYQVNCPLRSPAAVDEALRLARLALDKVT
jgi:hypothetical protein